MSTVSYTAKHFSKDDEEREIKELTDAEREEILHEMYGRNANNANDDEEEGAANDADNNNDDNDDASETNNDNEDEDDDDDDDEYRINGFLRDFNTAIEQIPQETSVNFWRAFFTSGHYDLIGTESNPALFFCIDNNNPERAALRMCKYWNMRVEIFGEENAFKPMTLQGAMKDVVPYMVHMPNMVRILPDDQHGRTVLCWDRTNVRFKDYNDDSIVIKIMWFVAHVALQKRSTENGVVVIGINQDSTWDFPPHNHIRLVVKSWTDCLPIKICCRHVCISSLFASFVLPIIKFFMSRDDRLRLQVYNTVKAPTMLNQLETFGLDRENLPKSIGGNYDVKPTWIEECEHILKDQNRRKKRQRTAIM